MVESYAKSQGYGYIARKKWPITLLALITVLFAVFALFSLAIGFPEVAGIIVAFMIIMLGVTVLFVIVPVYLLDLID